MPGFGSSRDTSSLPHLGQHSPRSPKACARRPVNPRLTLWNTEGYAGTKGLLWNAEGLLTAGSDPQKNQSRAKEREVPNDFKVFSIGGEIPSA